MLPNERSRGRRPTPVAGARNRTSDEFIVPSFLEPDIAMSQHAKTKLQRLFDAFREARYPGGYPASRNEDALARRLMSEFKGWCHQQGLATALEEAEREAALLEAADELEDSFGELAAEG